MQTHAIVLLYNYSIFKVQKLTKKQGGQGHTKHHAPDSPAS